MIRLSSLAFLLFSASATAHPAMDAIRTIDIDHLDRLPHRIVRTTTVDKKPSIEIASYNPLAPEGKRWKLESVDGLAPTEKQSIKFLKSKAGPKEPLLSAQIDPVSLSPVDDKVNPRRWRFRFRRGMEVEGIPLDKFSGQVSLNAAGQLAAVDVNLDEPMRVKLALKLSRMSTHAEYTTLPGGETVQTSSDSVIGGTIVGMSMNHASRTRFELAGSRNGG